LHIRTALLLDLRERNHDKLLENPSISNSDTGLLKTQSPPKSLIHHTSIRFSGFGGLAPACAAGWLIGSQGQGKAQQCPRADVFGVP